MKNKKICILSIIVVISLLLTTMPIISIIAKDNNYSTNNLQSIFNSDFDEWNYYKMITINHEKIEADQYNFPLLISIQDADLKDKAQSDGDDIAFSDYDGNKINHEIESYNSTTGNLTAWVNVTSLSSSADTIIYMYYGNPTCENQQNIIDVWDSDYVMVQHLEENIGTTVFDSTSNNNDGISTGTTFNEECKINGGRQYNGDEYITVNDFTTLSTALTAEAWVYRDDTTYISIFSEGTNYDTCDWILYLRTTSVDEGIDFGINDHNGHFFRAGSTPEETWFYLTVTYEVGNVTIYVDGLEVGSGTISSPINNNHFDLGLGNNNDGSQPWNGMLDELRISKIARDNDWIQTSFNNMNDPETFYILGPEEIINQKPVIFNPYPADDAEDVSTNLNELSFNITDPQGDAMDYTVETNPDIGSDSATGVNDGRYSIAVSGLESFTEYIWYVNVTDPTGSGDWTNESFIFSTIDTGITVEITKPVKNYFYIGDTQLFELDNKTFIYGSITVIANVSSSSDIDRVEFFVNDRRIGNDSEYPYEFNWSQIISFTKTIKVVAYDTEGNSATDELEVFKWRLHPLLLLAGAAFVLNPNTKLLRTPAGYTIIRGVIFNPVQKGRTLTFRAIRLHYTKVTFRGTESGVLKLQKCSIKTNGPETQIGLGPFGQVSWIVCKFRGTSLDQSNLNKIFNILM